MRECRAFSVDLAVTMLVCFIYFAREAAVALSTRHSPRLLWANLNAPLGRLAPRECEVMFAGRATRQGFAIPRPAAMGNPCLRGAPSAMAARLPPEFRLSARPGFPSDTSA